MANTVKIGISASDEGFKSTIQNAAKSAAELGNAMTGAGGKSKTLNGQLREAKKSAQELTMQWRALDDNMKNSDFGRNLQSQLQQVLDKAGELQDIKGDVANEIKNIASDTKMWDGAAQGIGILSSSIQGLASVVGLCGGNTEAFTKALTVMKGVEAATNTVIQIGNALQKDSALMVMLRALRTKTLATAETQAAVATTAHTTATEAQTVAQAANNAVAMANPYVAIAAAIIGVATAIWGAVKATDEETESLQKNNDASNTNLQWKERLKKSEEEWSDAVTRNASNQIQKYTELQLKWLQCNKDQKSREKFQREYGEEVNRVAGKVKKLSEYEDFFVKDTDKVVAAILARAAAEAGAEQYAKAMLKKAENDRNGTVANGRYYYTASAGTAFNDLSSEEQAYLKRVGGANASQNPYLQYHAGWSSYWEISEAGAKEINKFRNNVASQIRAQDDAEIAFWQGWSTDQAKKAAEMERAAGMGVGGGSNYRPPKAYSGSGGHHGSSGGGKHGSSGSGSDKPEEERKAAEQSLAWLREQLQEKQKALENGWIQPEKIEEEKSKIEYLKKEIEKKEIELGFKEPKAVIGSIDYLKEKISKLQDDLSKGLIPEEDVEKTKEQIEKMTDAITEQEIIIGIKPAPQTTFEAFELAHKYKNDWKDLDKFVSDYNAKWDEYAASMKKYEDDLKAYNDAWNTYNNKFAEYNKQQKQYAKYNELLKKREELEKKHDDEQISDDKYEKQLRALDEQIDKLANQLWPAVEDAEKDAINPFTELSEKYNKGLLTLEQYNVEFAKLCDAGVELEGVITRGFAKPIEPKLEIPKKPFAPGQEIDLKAIFGDSLDRIPAHVEQLMQMVNKRIEENASDGERVLGEQILNKLQEYLDEITLGKITIKANVVPTFSTEFGSDADLRASYENAQQNFQQIMSDFDMGLISTSDEAIEKLKEINKQLTDMGLKPIIIDIKPGWQQDLDNAANSLNQIGTIMGQIGEEADSKQLDAAKVIAQAIANIWLGYSEATAQAAKLGPWAWAGFSIGALGQVIGIIAAMNKYESGGIVGGSTTMGDRIVARLNAGEMVLNKRQQSNLFKALDHGIYGGSSATGPTTVRIKGEDLYISMHNHYKRTKKSPFK